MAGLEQALLPQRDAAGDFQALEVVKPAIARTGVASFAEAFSFGFQRSWSKALGLSRVWLKGFPAGGIDPFAQRPFNSLAAAERVFLGRFGPESLDALRSQDRGVLEHLRAFGQQMRQSGVLPVNLKESDLRAGVLLGNGSRAVIEEPVLEQIAQEQRRVFEAVRQWTWSLPDAALHYKKPKQARGPEPDWNPSCAPSARDRADVYALACVLGAQTDRQFAVVTSASAQSRGLIPLYRSFSPEYLRFFSNFQLISSWAFRKRIEPGGLSHPVIEHYRREKQLEPREKVFVSVFGAGLLNYLRAKGAPVIEHLREVGTRIVESGHAHEEGRFVDPQAGLPLLNGGSARIDPDVLDDIAFENHLLWLQTREWSFTIPNKRLHQPSVQERSDAHLYWERGKPNALWHHDRLHAYGHAYMLANMAALYPERYQAFVRAARCL